MSQTVACWVLELEGIGPGNVDEGVGTLDEFYGLYYPQISECDSDSGLLKHEVRFKNIMSCRYLFNDAEVKPFDSAQLASECFGGEMTVRAAVTGK